ncbi:hypothetical protein BKA56DRAFT_659968 [Ilyonectria sp. MPI-CAGE-AT-0026]|nr:hypothetical protein BKA56DRAFT_659968 [Ilyonectria sp. MPI-CAGE-AT-0026]
MRSISPSIQSSIEEEDSERTAPSPTQSQTSHASDSTIKSAVESIEEAYQETESDHSLPNDTSTSNRDQSYQPGDDRFVDLTATAAVSPVASEEDRSSPASATSPVATQRGRIQFKTTRSTSFRRSCCLFSSDLEITWRQTLLLKIEIHTFTAPRLFLKLQGQFLSPNYQSLPMLTLLLFRMAPTKKTGATDHDATGAGATDHDATDAGATVPKTKKPRAPRKTSYGLTFSGTDGVYRSFERACKAGDKGASLRGPTVGQFAGALMGMQDRDEANLPQCWHIFAEANKDHATLLRRSVAELRMSGKLRFKVQLPKKAAKMKKHLLISNPDHASGMPGTSKGGVGVSTSKAKPVVKPRNKRVPKKKMTFANDEDEDEDEEDSYDGNVSESDLPPKKKQRCMVERERSHRSRPTPKYGKVSKNGEAETVRKYTSFEDNEAFLAWLDESVSIGVKKEDDQVLATVPKYTHDLGNNE